MSTYAGHSASLFLSSSRVAGVPVSLTPQNRASVAFGDLVLSASAGENLPELLRVLAERVERATAEYAPLLAAGQIDYVEVNP